MNIKPPVRPQDAINRLMSLLEPHATPINMVARKRLSWEYKGKIQLYLFKKGELSIFAHRTDYLWSPSMSRTCLA